MAPFRSFLEERCALARQAHAAGQPPPAPCFLFFGCRSPAADFYYQAQWEEYRRLGVLDREHGLITAFSRHTPEQQAQQGQAVQGQQAQGQGKGQEKGEGGEQQNAGAAAAPTSKVYVTQRIREHGALVWRLLNGLPPAAAAAPATAAVDNPATAAAAAPTAVHSAHSGAGEAAAQAAAPAAAAMEPAVVYVSGSAQKMPAGVAAAFADVAVAHGGLDKEAAAAWVRQLELRGRYFVEAWS